jgi:hypothetical protein
MATTRKTAPTAGKRPAAKPAVRPAAKAAAQPVAKPVAKAPAALPVAAPDLKADKPKKPKLVRDSFTIPKTEYAVLEALKARAVKAGAPIKKSELLRAGIKTLAELGEGAFLKAVSSVPAIKTGRPAKV